VAEARTIGKQSGDGMVDKKDRSISIGLQALASIISGLLISE